MRMPGIAYRAHQFWNALSAAPEERELDQVSSLLGQRLTALFSQMQPGDQAHCLAVMRQLRGRYAHLAERVQRDLFVAALLHDVGKALYPLTVWERVLIVLTNRLIPQVAVRWGQGDPIGWKRAFVVACQHARWGAELAASAGASPLVVELIRRHHDPPASPTAQITDQLLTWLQEADGNN